MHGLTKRQTVAVAVTFASTQTDGHIALVTHICRCKTASKRVRKGMSWKREFCNKDQYSTVQCSTSAALPSPAAQCPVKPQMHVGVAGKCIRGHHLAEEKIMTKHLRMRLSMGVKHGWFSAGSISFNCFPHQPHRYWAPCFFSEAPFKPEVQQTVAARHELTETVAVAVALAAPLLHGNVAHGACVNRRWGRRAAPTTCPW